MSATALRISGVGEVSRHSKPSPAIATPSALTAMPPGAAAQHEAFDGHRVEHFVGEDDAAHGPRGPGVQPRHAARQVRGELRDARALALGEVRAHLQDAIGIRQGVERGELGEHVGGHATRTGADLEHVTAGIRQHVRGLSREAAREQARHLGRGHEIAGRAELGGAGAVVPEPGRVQREPHERVEADDAAVLPDELADVLRDAPDVRAFVAGKLREGCERRAGSHRVR